MDTEDRIHARLRRAPEADLEKAGRRIGRWLGKYPAAAGVLKGRKMDIVFRDDGGTPRGVKMAIDRGLFPGPRLRIAVAAAFGALVFAADTKLSSIWKSPAAGWRWRRSAPRWGKTWRRRLCP